MAVSEFDAELTHVTFFDGTKMSGDELFERVGMTVGQWLTNVDKITTQRTHCVVGACAFSLAEFEATHEHIVLGQD